DFGDRSGGPLMALHFERAEFDARKDRLLIEMTNRKLDAALLFAQESMYWLTGYDTFGFCFFQCLVLKADGSMVLMTRSADLRQLLNDLGLLGGRIGVEYDTHGLTGRNARLLDEQLKTFGTVVDMSGMVGRLRLLKSPAEVKKAERAAALADDALDAALPLI